MTDYTISRDLFNIERFIKPHATNSKVLNERSGAIKYFVDTFNLNPKRLAPKLAHLDISMLYALQSQVKDRINRQSKETARKYFYYSIKVIDS